jgi:signal transduction histidine kinase
MWSNAAVAKVGTLLQVALADPDATVESLRAAGQEAITLGEQQDELLAALLTLASGEPGVDAWTTFDLAQISHAALAERGPETHDITVHTELSAASMTGDPRLVASLVANLVDNAFRYNVPGGKVEISTRATPDRAAITTPAPWCRSRRSIACSNRFSDWTDEPAEPTVTDSAWRPSGPSPGATTQS